MPRIGLLSDSHGRALTTRRAVDLLLAHDAQILLHLGDLGTVEVVDALAPHLADGRTLESHLVFGNTDWDAGSLGRYATSLGVQVDHPVGKLALERKRQLMFLHGDDDQAMNAALAAKPAYLCHGHTHRTRDVRQGSTRIINPGALFRAQKYTVALLDSASDQLSFYDVEDR